MTRSRSDRRQVRQELALYLALGVAVAAVLIGYWNYAGVTMVFNPLTWTTAYIVVAELRRVSRKLSQNRGGSVAG